MPRIRNQEQRSCVYAAQDMTATPTSVFSTCCRVPWAQVLLVQQFYLWSRFSCLTAIDSILGFPLLFLWRLFCPRIHFFKE